MLSGLATRSAANRESITILQTPLGEPTPERIGSRPVTIAARDGEQTWKPLYQFWKTKPSSAS